MKTIYSWRESLKRESKITLLLSFLLFYFLVFVLLLSGIYVAGVTYYSLMLSLLISVPVSFLIVFPVFFYVYNNPFSVVDVLLRARDPNLKDQKERRAVQIVENLSIATGFRNVKVKIIPWSIINAMTVSKKDEAVIYFTKGAIEKLDYYELEAVAAHEFGHIINKDSYYMTLGCVVAGITIIVSYFLIQIVPRIIIGKKEKEEEKAGLIAIACMILGWILALLSPFILRRILSKFSKEREFLADADAVYITKNPKALISVLVKVAYENTEKYVEEMEVPENVSLLFFDYESIETHPPIWERILKICEITGMKVDEKLIEKIKKIEENARKKSENVFSELEDFLFLLGG